MAETNIAIYENSIQDGQPLECYQFAYGGRVYLYTSSRFDVSVTIKGEELTRTEKYTADYIRRDNIKPSSQGDAASVAVTVDKDNAVAALFKGSPPSKKVLLTILRLHEPDHAAYDTIFSGEVTQAAFRDSECTLTVTAENWLNRKLPNFMRQFFCCNTVYDSKCRLNKADYVRSVYVDGVNGLTLTAGELDGTPDDYYAGGLIYYGDDVRMIAASAGKTLTLRYPFPTTPMGTVTVYPGCDQRFRTCALRFGNTINFTGCPYVQPAQDDDTKVGKGVYWVDSMVVHRDTDGYVGTISL